MAKRPPRLGKGLSALLSNQKPVPAAAAPAAEAPPADGLQRIRLDQIRPNPGQPRQTFDDASLAQLAQSIKASGMLQPVIVRPAGPKRYELIAGERRWRAARLAGLDTVPAIIHEVSDDQAFELALIENLQREDLNPLERGAAYQHYATSMKLSADQIAQRLGESRANVSNYMRMLKLPEEIREMVRSGQLGMGQARAIVALGDAQRQIAIARLSVRRNLAVRQVEELARKAERVATKEPGAPTGMNRHFTELERQWARSLGVKVKIKPGRKKNAGRIEIRFGSLEEYERLAERLGVVDVAE